MKGGLTYQFNDFVRYLLSFIYYGLKGLREKGVKDINAGILLELFAEPLQPALSPIEKIQTPKREKGKRFATAFYNSLKGLDKISCGEEQFKKHFTDKEPNDPTPDDNPISTADKIQYNDDYNQLVYIFKQLRIKEILPKTKTPHKQLAEHFLDQYGKPLDPKLLRQAFMKEVQNKEGREDAEKIIRQIMSDVNRG